MQASALMFAVCLLVFGAVLNTAVFVYFAWRTVRVLGPQRATRPPGVNPTLAPAHR